MELLSPGVLVKLLEQMKTDKKPMPNDDEDEDEPKLLQIRSIVPVLSEGDDDLWPKQGFYLEVSDSSHALCVSLPHEQDIMVLCDELRLGQLIFVDKIEKGSPVPVLRGIRPVPGRFPCVGKPEDLVSVDGFVSVSGVSEPVSEMGKKTRERFGSLSAPRAGLNGSRKDGFKSVNGGLNNQACNLAKDCDPGSTMSSSTPAPAMKRRSWNGVGASGHSVSSKPEMKPTSRSRSACASSIQSSKYDSSGGNSSSKIKNLKLDKSSGKSRTCTKSMRNCEESLDPTVTFSYVNDKELAKSKAPWNSLPRNLEKLGKDVEGCRDAALLASAEALQEASVAERLLKCLNTYSDLKTSKEKKKHRLVNVFFKLQEDLAQTRLIIQSLTNTSTPMANDTDQNRRKSTTGMLKLATDRKKNAGLWIKAALASDLIPLSVPTFPTNATRRSSTACASKTKDTSIVREKRNSTVGVQVRFETEKDNTKDWIKGSALCSALELTNSLDGECRRWFLGYAEKFLEEVKSKTMSLECSDIEVSEMMCQIKKVNDWLEVILEKEPKFLKLNNEDSEVAKACGRLRNKIYEVLLKHVERTAMAWGTHEQVVEVQQQ